MTKLAKIEVDIAAVPVRTSFATQEEVKADSFFKAGYKAADSETSEYILEFAVGVLGRKVQTPTNREKYLACMTDFFAMVRKSGQGLVSWQTGSEHYTGAAYSRQIAEKVKIALRKAGYLAVQEKSKWDRCRIYLVDKAIAPDWLKFKKNNSTNVVKVREAKVPGKKKGKLIPLSRYKSETVLPIIKEMEIINEMMEGHPLTAPDGTQWDGCCRLFNNGDPTGQTWKKLGGRVYGAWQSKTEQERLQCTIDGQEVCEVDIKACYLYLALQFSTSDYILPEDPYLSIRFVREQSSKEGRKQMKQLAKVLTSAMLSKDGPVERFPKGPKRSDGKGRHSLREFYGLGKKARCQDYVRQIEEAFPFIVVPERKGLELMFEESEVMVGSMLALGANDIPTFPVHDCLLCKKVDEEKVVREIQLQMQKRYQTYATLEVGYRDGSNKVLPSSQNIGLLKDTLSSTTSNKDGEEEDPYDYSVIEDF